MTDPALDKVSGAAARWSLRVFGGFELVSLSSGAKVGLPRKRERILLAYLAFSPNFRQPRRKLATLLWGETTNETALDNLRNSVWSLRKALGDTEHRIVASEGEDIVLDAAAFDMDALAFRRLAAQSGRTELEAAANLCSGEFLDGLDVESEEFESWRRTEAARYRDQIIDVLTRLIEQLITSGQSERAIEVGSRILRLEPLHEQAVRCLMRLYGENGRRGTAVQIYRTLVDALRIELDAEPEAETRLVFAEITRGAAERNRELAATDTKPSPAFPNIAPSAAREPAASAFALRGRWAILTAGVIFAVALVSYRQLESLANRQGSVAEQATHPAEARDAISIAVLPFINLSGEPDQEFFSDGMTEEITAALSKIRELRVVGRTSAFQFKGDKMDLRAIGKSLNATHLLEGSVRKDGNRVRITAQLIRANDGVHVWTENYDRNLIDIFSTQEDIGTAIAGALRVPLGLRLGESLVRDRTTDLESYEQYLRAKALYRARALPDAIKILESIVARNPSFGAGWALLGQAWVVSLNFSIEVRSGSMEKARRRVQITEDKAENAAREAIRLDPNNAIGYSVLARVQAFHHGKWGAADDLYNQALALDPNEPDVLLNYAVTLASEGRLKEALSVMEKLRALEPFVPIFNVMDAHYYQLTGHNETAIPILEMIPAAAGGGLYRNVFLAQAYAAAGNYTGAADTLLRVTSDQVSQRSVQDAARLMRSAPQKAKTLEALPALDQDLHFVYAYVGALDRIVEYYTRQSNLRYGIDDLIWLPDWAPLRNTDRFKAVARDTGLVDYWRTRGWPDLCRPMGADNFVCD